MLIGGNGIVVKVHALAATGARVSDPFEDAVTIAEIAEILTNVN